MSDATLLTTLLPVRDPRERVIAYELRTHPGAHAAANDIDAEARAVLALLRTRDLLRLARPRPLHVPITPGVLRSGAITSLASADVVFTLAVDVLDDADGRRAVERYAATGFRFAFVVDVTNVRLPVLAGPLAGAWMMFDASAIDGGLAAANVVQRLLAAGARPIARHVDDRATRERLRAGGVAAFSGRALPRGRGASRDARRRALEALRHLGRLADGRPVDNALEAFMGADAELTDAVLRPLGSSGTGAARPRTLGQAVMRSGREALADRLMVGTAFLLAESAGTPDLAGVAIARARMLQRLGTALERTGHPRGHLAAGLLSCAEHALGLPAPMLADTLELGAPMRDVVITRRSPLGMLVDLVEAYESGWWDDLLARTDRLGIAPGVVTEAWRTALLDARDEVAARAAADA
mgnify:CR=1 FL=1